MIDLIDLLYYEQFGHIIPSDLKKKIIESLKENVKNKEENKDE